LFDIRLQSRLRSGRVVVINVVMNIRDESVGLDNALIAVPTGVDIPTGWCRNGSGGGGVDCVGGR